MATTGAATAGLNAGLRLAAARSIAPGSAAARFTAPRSAAAARSVTTGPRSAAAARSVITGSATARCTGPRSAAVARSATTGSTTARLTAPRSAAARFTAPRFSALHQVGRVRSGSRIVPSRCAADAPPSSTDTTPPADAPPSSTDTTPPRPLPNTSKWLKFWNEIKSMGFSLAMLLVAVFIGAMASKYDAKAGWAANLVTLCEKIEKVHKLLSHILPLVIAIVKSFW